MRKATSPPAFATLVLLTAVSTLSLNMLLPSLANIALEFDAEYSTISIAVAGYLGVAAVVQLIVGNLSDRLGRRPVILSALVIFCAASIMCSLVSNVWLFLGFRMLQACIISGYVLSLAVVRDTTPEREAAGIIGYLSMAMAFAPMLGPMLGGVLDASFGWRSNFYFYASAAVLLFFLCWFDLGETKDFGKADSAEQKDRVSDLLREPLFWALSCCSAFSIGAFFVFLTGAPLVAQEQFGFSTAEIGLFIGSITAGFMFGGFISGRLAPKVEPTHMMLAGRLFACTGLGAGMLIVLSGSVSPMIFFGSTIFVGLGNGLTSPSSNAAVLSVRPKLAGTAAGLNGAMIVAIGSVLTAFTGYILPQEAPALSVLFLMFCVSFVGLLAVLTVILLKHKAKQLDRG